MCAVSLPILLITYLHHPLQFPWTIRTIKLFDNTFDIFIDSSYMTEHWLATWYASSCSRYLRSTPWHLAKLLGQLGHLIGMSDMSESSPYYAIIWQRLDELQSRTTWKQESRSSDSFSWPQSQLSPLHQSPLPGTTSSITGSLLGPIVVCLSTKLLPVLDHWLLGGLGKLQELHSRTPD